MKFRGLLIPCAMLLAGVAVAPSTVASQVQQDDRWEAAPATASSSNYRADRLLPRSSASSHSSFHFKQPAKRGPAYELPPQANDKAAVMGKPRPWQNGRPPLDCAITPRDPACR